MLTPNLDIQICTLKFHRVIVKIVNFNLRVEFFKSTAGIYRENNLRLKKS